MMQKEVVLKNPVILGRTENGGVNETNKIVLREPTAGDLRGLSLKALVVDSGSDDWVVLLSRISSPAIPTAAINLMGMKDFSLLIGGALEILGEEETTQENTQKE